MSPFCDTANDDGAVILTALWTKHTWTEIRPYNVGLRAFVIIGRDAVLRYRQWRRGCHLDCILDKTYMDRNTSVQRRIEGFRDHWPRCCLAIPPMATGAVILTAFWTKYTWTEIRPYNVGLRAFVIIGRVAVLRYRQWRQSCHLDCIMRKLKVFKSIVISMRLVNDSRA